MTTIIGKSLHPAWCCRPDCCTRCHLSAPVTWHSFADEDVELSLHRYADDAGSGFLLRFHDLAFNTVDEEVRLADKDLAMLHAARGRLTGLDAADDDVAAQLSA